MTKNNKNHFRTIFISDVHLGTPACKAEALQTFLKNHTCDKLYLVGDIVDGWALKNRWHWPSEHNQVVRRILKKSEKEGTEVVYVTGNHDEFLREYTQKNDLVLGSIRITNEDVHKAADGRSFWVVHGDKYDAVMKHYKAVELLGDISYSIIVKINNYYDLVRRNFRGSKFSLIKFMKNKIKLVGKFVDKFEKAILFEAGQRGYDGVVCGHIHQPNHKFDGKVEYWNDGDWVENCTMLLEDRYGKFSIGEWCENCLDEQGNSEYKLIIKNI